MFQSESFYFDDFTSLCSCPVLWKYILIFIFVSEFSPRVPTFLSLCLGFLMTLRCPGRSRECLVTREIASRNIWQYLNNNKASLGQPEHEVTFYPSPSLSAQVRTGSSPLISEIVSEKSGASCFYLGDRPSVDSKGKQAKIDFYVDGAIKRGPELEATF